MNKEDLIEIREPHPGDLSFIRVTWLKGLYYGGGGFFRKIPKTIFMESYKEVIDKVLTSPTVIVNIACLKEDKDVIVGYSVSRKAADITVLDFVYVKKDWRGIGIARDLLPKTIYAASHLTRAGEALLEKLYPSAIFNPFVL